MRPAWVNSSSRSKANFLILLGPRSATARYALSKPSTRMSGATGRNGSSRLCLPSRRAGLPLDNPCPWITSSTILTSNGSRSKRKSFGYCEELGIPTDCPPRRIYTGAGGAVTRYFNLKLPIAGGRTTTFVYVDPGNGTSTEALSEENGLELGRWVL